MPDYDVIIGSGKRRIKILPQDIEALLAYSTSRIYPTSTN